MYQIDTSSGHFYVVKTLVTHLSKFGKRVHSFLTVLVVLGTNIDFVSPVFIPCIIIDVLHLLVTVQLVFS